MGLVSAKSLTYFFVVIFLFDLVLRRNYRRYVYYQAAQQLSQDVSKPLLVVGANDLGGVSGSISSALELYGCGDRCIDIQGCRECPGSADKQRIEDVLPLLPTNSHVIYLSCVLEYVDSVANVTQELFRVSGGDLFIVHLDNLIDLPHFGSYIDPKTHEPFTRKWRIISAPPNSPTITYVRAN